MIKKNIMRIIMKYRYYLRGAGIGIIATTLIFTIANAVTSSNENKISEKEQPTTESSVLAYTQKDTQSETTVSSEETTQQQITQETIQETTQETTQSETIQTEALTEEQTEPPVQTKAAIYLPDDEVQIEIGSGYNATQVADMLLEAGIISDREGFIGYMVETGNSVKMIAGTHIVKKNDSFENLAAVITSR